IALKAAVAASRTIPIVVWANNFDPIERGYVQSLAQPGGNVTGVFTRQLELATKQIELLKETFPERKRVTALWDELSADQYAAGGRGARPLTPDGRGVKLEHPPYDTPAVFRQVAATAPDMLAVLSSPLFGPHHKEIAEQATLERLPSMFILKV